MYYKLQNIYAQMKNFKIHFKEIDNVKDTTIVFWNKYCNGTNNLILWKYNNNYAFCLDFFLYDKYKLLSLFWFECISKYINKPLIIHWKYNIIQYQIRCERLSII